MAHRATTISAEPATLTRVQRRIAIARLQHRILALQAFDPAIVNDRDENRVVVLARTIDQALIRIFGAGTADYRRYAEAQRLDRAGHLIGRTPSLEEIRAGFQRGKQAAIALLEGLITRLQACSD
jgi:hypothetical protein